MACEVHYTSAPRGVFPGTHGYSTVACSAQMPRALVERIESLSAYRNVYPPHDPKATLNPIAYTHLRIATTAGPRHLISRIGSAGLDYTDRANKYAHHIILDPTELPRGGPAWLMGRPGFLNATWDGHVGFLPESRPSPQGDRPPRVCEQWAKVTGDAGWAAVLAEAYLSDPKRVAFLVYEPGSNLLPLFEEALALLPADRRWDVSFSTYFTGLPQGISCTWRGVVRKSPEAAQAAATKQALILDLTQPLGQASGGPLLALARTGSLATPPPLTTFETVSPEPPPFPEYASPPSVGWRSPNPSGGMYDLVTNPHTPASAVPPPLMGQPPSESLKRRRRLPAIVGAVLLLVALIAGSTYYVLSEGRRPNTPRQISRPPVASEPSTNKGQFAKAKPAPAPINGVTQKNVANHANNTLKREAPQKAPSAHQETRDSLGNIPATASSPTSTQDTGTANNSTIKQPIVPEKQAKVKSLAQTKEDISQPNAPARSHEAEQPIVHLATKLPSPGKSELGLQPINEVHNFQNDHFQSFKSYNFSDHHLRLMEPDDPLFRELNLQWDPSRNDQSKLSISIRGEGDDPNLREIALFAIKDSHLEFRWSKSVYENSTNYTKHIRAIRSCILELFPATARSKSTGRFQIALRLPHTLPDIDLSLKHLNAQQPINDKSWDDQGKPLTRKLFIKHCVPSLSIVRQSNPNDDAKPFRNSQSFTIDSLAHLSLEIKLSQPTDPKRLEKDHHISLQITPDLKTIRSNVKESTSKFNLDGIVNPSQPISKETKQDLEALEAEVFRLNNAQDRDFKQKQRSHPPLPTKSSIAMIDHIIDDINKIPKSPKSEQTKQSTNDNSNLEKDRIAAVKQLLNLKESLIVLSEFSDLYNNKIFSSLNFNIVLAINVAEESVPVAEIGEITKQNKKLKEGNAAGEAK